MPSSSVEAEEKSLIECWKVRERVEGEREALCFRLARRSRATCLMEKQLEEGVDSQ